MMPPLPERPALFLDFDGTLVEIADTPDGVVVAPELPALMERLAARTDGALAVVSGRPIAEIDGFLALAIPAAGMHGLERRSEPGAKVERVPTPPEMDELRARITAFPFLKGGVRMEDKGAGLAVHYRGDPSREGEVRAAMQDAVRDLDALHLINGKMVVEAKRKGFDKGAAVRAFMEGVPFAGRTAVFIGDDVTDEDGIRAAEACGGFGVKVGEGDSAAAHRLTDVAAVHRWLAELARVPA